MTIRYFYLAAFLAISFVPGNSPLLQAQDNSRGFGAAQIQALKARNSANQFTIDTANRQAINQGVTSVGVVGVNRQNFATGNRSPLVGNAGIAGSGAKPFSRLDRGPTVSPYLALSNPFSTPSDYYNIVKPQQEQSRVNQQMARQQYTQSRKLNQLAAQGPYQITGTERYAPTGHGSGFMRFGTYMNTGGYFAPPTQPKGSR